MLCGVLAAMGSLRLSLSAPMLCIQLVYVRVCGRLVRNLQIVVVASTTSWAFIISPHIPNTARERRCHTGFSYETPHMPRIGSTGNSCRSHMHTIQPLLLISSFSCFPYPANFHSVAKLTCPSAKTITSSVCPLSRRFILYKESNVSRLNLPPWPIVEG